MQYDLIIVGGGLNGSALALAAASSGLRSCVIDALPASAQLEEGFDGRAYALALSSVRLLQRLGLWRDLDAHAQPMMEIKVRDGRVGEAQAFLGLHFQSAEIEEGPMGQMIEDRHLRRALHHALSHEPAITHLSQRRVIAQDIRETGASVTLENGESLQAKLLIGADGRASPMARRAGLRRTGWSYGQTALVCAIAHERPHEGIAHQLFLPAGPLAILPLPGNRSSIVWSERDSLARAINKLPDQDYLDVLRPRFGDFLGEISLAGARYSYPLGLSIANHMIAPRLALIGDAAHGLHPIAGQGLNAGLRDVATLAHVLSHACRRGEDIASPFVLERYATWRRFDVASLGAATDIFNKLFSNNNAVLRGLRDMGMSLINATPSLRRNFIREAAGLTGDLPELLR